MGSDVTVGNDRERRSHAVGPALLQPAVVVAERDNVLGSCLITNFLFVLAGEGVRRLSGVLATNGIGAKAETSTFHIFASL